jgi:hypothetical protein
MQKFKKSIDKWKNIPIIITQLEETTILDSVQNVIKRPILIFKRTSLAQKLHFAQCLGRH